MAAVSLSPTPVQLTAMATRRTPLSSNPNAANSPLRGAGAGKSKRPYGVPYVPVLREELSGHPPPAKRQMLDNGRPAKVQFVPQPQQRVPSVTARSLARDKSTNSAAVAAENGQGDIEAWRRHHKARFPKIVFYFESVPDDVRLNLAKQVASLGAREEKFFSINITHVITTRSIPPADKTRDEASEMRVKEPEPEEQPQTINPSLLDRSSDAARRLLLNPSSRRLAALPQLEALKVPARNTDVLCKARDMGKKIWALEKLQRMLNLLLEDGTHAGAGHAAKVGGLRTYTPLRDGDLQQLLQNERLNGPSDRDPTVATRELNYFKGPYIYVYDIDEKQKPIMVREYPKVTNKHDGEWPQFRSVANGRCPFVEDVEPAHREPRQPKEPAKAETRERESRRAVKLTTESTTLHPPAVPPPKPLTGKRSLTEMEDGHNKGRSFTQPLDRTYAGHAKQFNFQPQQNAFTSRHAPHGRVLGGEPVASGVQPSNVTSAIRSNMISSVSGLAGTKAGTSKELHGLQRKVLRQGASAVPTSRDLSSRQLAEMSLDHPSSRSFSISHQNSRKMHPVEEETTKDRRPSTQAAQSQQAPQPKPKKEMKAGYCENCGDRFRDFDEHIMSRKHRRFAETADNWAELDSLLSQLKRMPKHSSHHGLEDDLW